ncbi:hypothetical protein P7K49_035684 [Saguinus oedipus]|uniref:Fibronectin type-III domain-containing protein n=1 Tax=Saguinus oedipus TaxID=9490 RepID=A0ABQ9TNK0_SAGOE|nr:hypothetical protein P7K49_035684 [Saguinus oedipus]
MQSLLIPTEPGPVEDVQCQPEATCLALNWTVPAGDVGTCLVVAEQLAGRGNAHLVFQANTSRNAVLLPDLVPGTSYGPSLSVPSRNGLWSRAVTVVFSTSAEGSQLLLPLGLPPFPVFLGMSLLCLASSSICPGPRAGAWDRNGRMIPWGMFGKDDGQIIATTTMSHESWAQEGMGRP